MRRPASRTRKYRLALDPLHQAYRRADFGNPFRVSRLQSSSMSFGIAGTSSSASERRESLVFHAACAHTSGVTSGDRTRAIHALCVKYSMNGAARSGSRKRCSGPSSTQREQQGKIVGRDHRIPLEQPSPAVDVPRKHAMRIIEALEWIALRYVRNSEAANHQSSAIGDHSALSKMSPMELVAPSGRENPEHREPSLGKLRHPSTDGHGYEHVTDGLEARITRPRRNVWPSIRRTNQLSGRSNWPAGVHASSRACSANGSVPALGFRRTTWYIRVARRDTDGSVDLSRKSVAYLQHVLKARSAPQVKYLSSET